MLKRVGLYVSIAAAVVIAVVYRTMVLCPISYSPVDLSGQVAVVTGGTSGIGFETVKKLMEWNATVIMPVRNLKKGEAVREELTSHLAALPVHSTGTVELMKLDLASFASVRLFAKELLEKDIHVDILILNAGMQTGDELTLSEDGVEMLYQVNHLSQFLLTRLLLPTLSHTPGRIARIVHVSSSMHYIGQIDRDAYNSSALNSIDSTRRTSFQSYSDSKLMNAVFSNSLDRFFRQEGNEQYSGISSVSIHPGFVVSDLDRGLPSHMEVILRTIRSLVARPTIDGAVTQVTAATHPQLLAHGGGLYFEDQCIMSHCTSCLLCSIDKERGAGVIPHGSATSFEDQDWLWDTSSAIVGLSKF